jgi:uncharacterized membrane protein
MARSVTLGWLQVGLACICWMPSLMTLGSHWAGPTGSQFGMSGLWSAVGSVLAVSMSLCLVLVGFAFLHGAFRDER